MRMSRLVVFILIAASGILGCSAGTPAALTNAARSARWVALAHVRGVVDLSSERPDGRLIVAARGRLFTGRRLRSLGPFAPGYRAPARLEPYIALASHGLAGRDCRFPAGTLYALRLSRRTGVAAITPGGAASSFALLPRRGLDNGITFDTAGRFLHRLLVTNTDRGFATVYAIDCRGHAVVITRGAPRVEGGIAVAPHGFGRFAGDLIAADEHSGRLFAFSPSGSWRLLARSGLPHGPDIGVESLGFVPTRFRDALVADRGTPGNPHPGDDVVLGLSRSALWAVGVRAGDLLAVTEGGAQTVAVRCRRTCSVRVVATGPPEAHVEGHVVFVR